LLTGGSLLQESSALVRQLPCTILAAAGVAAAAAAGVCAALQRLYRFE
jgi:hypothetical protein